MKIKRMNYITIRFCDNIVPFRN